MICCMHGDVLERVDHEIQRLAARKCLDARTPEFGFFVPGHGRYECLRQNHCVFDQIGNIENKSASSSFAVQHGQAMR